MIDLRGGTWLGQVPLVERRSLGAGAQDFADSDFAKVLAAPKAIVDFWSPGCPHCMAFKPVFEATAAMYPDILFAAINVDNYQQQAAINQITGLPGIVFFQNGKEVDRVEGGMEQAGFQAEIAKAFSGQGTPGSPRPQGMIAAQSSSSSVLPYVLAGFAGVGALAAGAYFLLRK